MSLTTEINRIRSAKNTLKAKAAALGLTVPSNARLDDIASIINGYTPPTSTAPSATLYIADEPHTITKGMSWEEYMDADGCCTDGNDGSTYVYFNGTSIKYADGRIVRTYDLIIPGHRYRAEL